MQQFPRAEQLGRLGLAVRRFVKGPAVQRMNILNTVEQEALESAPVLNSFQRQQYF